MPQPPRGHPRSIRAGKRDPLQEFLVKRQGNHRLFSVDQGQSWFRDDRRLNDKSTGVFSNPSVPTAQKILKGVSKDIYLGGAHLRGLGTKRQAWKRNRRMNRQFPK